MPISGTLINCALIAAGTLLGLAVKKILPDRVRDTLMQAVGLVVLFIGIGGAVSACLTYADGAFGTKDTLVMILSMTLGAALGELIDIEKHLDALGARCRKRFAADGDSAFASGMVTATLLFCVGAMAIMGALDSGLTGDHSTLYAKALLDGIISVVYASTLGIGVALSAIPIFLYQGAIALGASFLAPYLTEAVILEMKCVGSILILGLSLNMLGLTKIKVMNYVPAVFLPILLCRFL